MSNDTKVAAVLPIHALPKDTKIKRSPGRPRKIEKKPTIDDLEYHRKMAAARLEYTDAHPMVQINKPPEKSSGNKTVDNLTQIKYQIACEAAVLEFNRKEIEKRGVSADVGQLSTRIIAAWKQVSDIELEVKKLGVTVLDPNSEEMQRVFRLWISTLEDIQKDMVSEGIISTEALDLFFNKFGASMEDWESKVSQGT